MANDDRIKIIPRGTPESAAMLANVKRAMAITANLNRLTFNDADEVRALFSAYSIIAFAERREPDVRTVTSYHFLALRLRSQK